MNLTTNMKAARIKLGWSQQQMAHYLCVSRSVVRRIEAGKVPEPDVIERWAHACSLTVEDLWGAPDRSGWPVLIDRGDGRWLDWTPLDGAVYRSSDASYIAYLPGETGRCIGAYPTLRAAAGAIRARLPEDVDAAKVETPLVGRTFDTFTDAEIDALPVGSEFERRTDKTCVETTGAGLRWTHGIAKGAADDRTDDFRRRYDDDGKWTLTRVGPVAKVETPKQGPPGLSKPCPLCKGKGIGVAVDSVGPEGITNPRPETCIVCEGNGYLLLAELGADEEPPKPAGPPYSRPFLGARWGDLTPEARAMCGVGTVLGASSHPADSPTLTLAYSGAWMGETVNPARPITHLVLTPATLIAEQPAPLPATGDLWAELIAVEPPGPIRDLMAARREQGIAKYGTPLQRGNGRDFTADAIQEALDGMVYAHGAGTGDSANAVVGFRIALLRLMGDHRQSVNEQRALAAEKERDEERVAKVAYRQGVIGLPIPEGAPQSTCDAWYVGRNDVRTHVKRIETDRDEARRERDEARAQLANVATILSRWSGPDRDTADIAHAAVRYVVELETEDARYATLCQEAHDALNAAGVPSSGTPAMRIGRLVDAHATKATPPATANLRRLALATVRDANERGWKLPAAFMDMLDAVVGVERG